MSHPMTAEDRARVARERRTLRKTLNDLGVTDFTVAVTGHQAGRPVAWASLPLNDVHAALYTTLTEAGFVVRTGAHTLAILMGETA